MKVDMPLNKLKMKDLNITTYGFLLSPDGSLISLKCTKWWICFYTLLKPKESVLLKDMNSGLFKFVTVYCDNLDDLALAKNPV